MKIIKKESPNHYNGRAGNKADIIVFHQTGGDSLAKALAWYMNPSSQCSPNYVIDFDGTIYQLVDPNNAAWANGTSTKPSDNKYYGYSLSKLVRDRKTNANYYSYSIEYVHCQYGNITDKQIQATVELIGMVIFPNMMSHGTKPIADREHFLGHSDVTPKTRDPEKFNCPGRKFPYDEIISCVLGKKVAPMAQTIDSSKKSIDEIAKEVIRGKWGAGAERKTKLESSGYNYKEVQDRVNDLLKR